MVHNNWLFFVGLVLVSSFLPLIAVSHLLIRLPHKRKEYQLIMKTLKENGIKRESFFVLNDDKVFVDDKESLKDKVKDYLLPLLFVSVFSFMGFWILFDNKAEILLTGINYAKTTGAVPDYGKGCLVTMAMAFLGSYLWSAQYLFRRLVTVDLCPGAYYSVGLRLIMGSFIAVAFYHFISYLPETALFGLDVIPDKTLKNMIPVVGFITGMVPQRAIKYMGDFFKFSTSKKENMADELPLDMIEGITSFYKYRFSEEGIDNVQNLAQASLMELIVKTPYRPRQLVDWMAQARLCLSFKSDVVKLRKVGIRTMLDLINAGDNDRLTEIAEKGKLDEVQFQTVYAIFKNNTTIKQLAVADNCL